MTVSDGAIVVGVDDSPAADHAVGWAARQAVTEGRALVVAHAVESHLVTPRERGREVLERAVAEASALAPDVQVHEVVHVGDPRELLVDLSATAAQLVLGSRGRGPVRSLLLGSTSVAVSRHAHCPVVVHRGGPVGLPKEGILVGADATSDSLPVLEFAYRQADLHHLALTVFHSRAFGEPGDGLDPGDPTDTDQRVAIAESVAGMAEIHPDVIVRRIIEEGMPEVPLLDLSRDMDLLVVGRHQRTAGQQFMFGPLSVWLLEHASCPVAVVPVGPLRKGPA